jgi:hypothetical protein
MALIFSIHRLLERDNRQRQLEPDKDFWPILSKAAETPIGIG